MRLAREHAWTLCRILSGQTVNGELQALPEPFLALGCRLAALPEEARQTPWDAFLDGRDDRDEIIMSMANVDPKEERPEAETIEEEAADEWGPIRLGTLPLAEPFPLNVLPEPMARLVNDGAESIGCPPDFLALPALAIAGGVIGRSISLNLKDGYFASSILFAACVGPPSDGKTPAFKAVTSAVRRIDELLEIQYKEALARWEEEATQPLPDGKKALEAPASP